MTEDGHVASLGALTTEAQDFLDAARTAAIVHFGDDAVREIPRLVTDTATLMATLRLSHDSKGAQ